jgi:hypothetical protein
MIMEFNIEAAARRVAEAKHRQADADAAVDAAKAAAAAVQSRVDALQAERASIVEAARNGDAEGKAGLRLAVVDADIADLAPLVADAQAGVQHAQSEMARATQAVASAERDFAVEKDRATEALLVERAETLAGMLTTAVTELKAIQGRRGGRASWAPGTELVRALTSLRLAADRGALSTAA